MSKRVINQDDLLSLINCGEDYGHWNAVCMSALVNWAAPITDEDIQRFASCFISEEGLAQGYTEEDYTEAVDKIETARSTYQKKFYLIQFDGPGIRRGSQWSLHHLRGGEPWFSVLAGNVGSTVGGHPTLR